MSVKANKVLAICMIAILFISALQITNADNNPPQSSNGYSKIE